VPVLVHAHPRRELRLRPAIADAPQDAPPTDHRRAPRYAGKTGIWSTNKAIAQAERALAQQAELAYNNTVRD
jgi:hypothetical protein